MQPGVFFMTAGISMGVHLAFGALARRGLVDQPVLESALFGIPNRVLGTASAIRLMRVRYCLPFQALPKGAAELSAEVKASLAIARLAGLTFICAISGFFISSFLQSGR